MNYYNMKKNAQIDIKKLVQKDAFTAQNIVFQIQNSYGLSKKFTLEYINMLIEHDFAEEKEGILKMRKPININ